MKKKSKVKAANDALEVINLKVTSRDRKRLEQNAKRYADGNLSAWLRYVGMQYTPKKGEEIVLDARR